MSRFLRTPRPLSSSLEKQTIQRFVGLLLSEKENIKAFILYSIAANILLLAIPFGVKSLVDQLTILYYQQSTLFLLIFITLFLVGIAFMRAMQLYLSERFQRRLFFDLTKDLSAALSKKTLKHTKPHLIQHFFEVITLQKTSAYLAFDGLTLVLQTTLGIILISIYHPIFILYSLAIIFALYYIVRVLGSGLFELAVSESKYKYIIINWLYQLSQREEPQDHESETEDLLLKYMTARESRFKVHFKQSLGLLMTQVVASCLLLGLGGFLVLQQKMTLGQLIASELIISNVLISIIKFTNILDYWYDSLVSVHKISHTLEEIYET